jgi:hypothetical protein
MSPAQHLRLELLRDAAREVLLHLDTEQDATELGTLLVLTLLAIDRITPPSPATSTNKREAI